MVEKKEKNMQEDLKQLILSSENKKEYRSDKFKKIEEHVKLSLKNQKTDNALRDLTLWALVLRSSDIHFEVFEDYIVIRFRIDWVLVDIFKLSHKEYKLILERLKYSSWLKLNITDVPQDGKYSMIIDERDIDVRISTLPVWMWENVVARLLDNTNSVVDFDDLWFFWTTKRILEKSIAKKNWLILVTWPTWSGKTTTLYTMLSKLNTRDKKVITLEDPIEYQMEWVIQSEINEKKWYDFSNWLKALLRQDPDIIMVWEVRDHETLQTVTQASLTGHLVLSTLHTKSAADTLDRIINMWLKSYVIASALDTIIAQRLVRKICPHCKAEKQKTPQDQAMIEAMMQDIWMSIRPAKNIKLYEWKWCEKCNHSWYSWRLWIYEIIHLNETLRNMIREWASVEEIIREARNGDLITIKEDWILKAIKWYTTIEEILRVI